MATEKWENVPSNVIKLSSLQTNKKSYTLNKSLNTKISQTCHSGLRSRKSRITVSFEKKKTENGHNFDTQGRNNVKAPA